MSVSRKEPPMATASAELRNTATCSRERRNSAVLKSGLGRINRVADTPDGLDERHFERPVHLRPDATDMGFDDAGARVEIEVPDLFEQHRARNHLAGVTHQVFQEAKFARLQLDPP